MKTSLNKTEEIDAWLLEAKSPEEMLLFDAQMLLNPRLSETVRWQQQVHTLVKAYPRKKLKQEIRCVHNQLFLTSQHRSFRQRILTLFR